MRAIWIFLACLADPGRVHSVHPTKHQTLQGAGLRDANIETPRLVAQVRQGFTSLAKLLLAFKVDAAWQNCASLRKSQLQVCQSCARQNSAYFKMQLAENTYFTFTHSPAFGDDWIQTSQEPPDLLEPMQPEVSKLLKELNLTKSELYKGAGLWEQADVVDPSTVGALEPELDSLKREVLTRVRTGAVPMLGVLLMKDGHTVCSVAAGEASDGQPLTPRSLLRFYSMTKPIVSLAALILTEENKLDLDAPVSKYLRCWDDDSVTVLPAGSPAEMSEPAQKPITIRMLLTHTSGLSYGFLGSSSEVCRLYRQRALELPHPLTEHSDQNEPPAQSLYDWAARLNAVPLAVQPGSAFEYGHSTDLLGAVLEQVSGESLGSFLHQRIFEPLGMNDTSFTISESALPRFGTCYRAKALGEWTKAEYPRYEIAATDKTSPWAEDSLQGRVHSGGAGLISTAEDYARFTQCLANGGKLDGKQIISEATFDAATSDQLAPLGARRAGIVEAAYEGFGLLGGVVTTDRAPRGYLPAGAASGPKTTAWGGAAGTYFFADPLNCFSCVIYTQLLDYGVGAPDLRPAICRAACRVFPHMRDKLDAAEPRVQADGKAKRAEELVQGFTG